LENCVIVGIDMDVAENDRAGDAGHNQDHRDPGEAMRLIKLVQVTLVLAILGFPFAPLVVVEAVAGPYEDAEAAYDAQNYAKTLKDLNPLVMPSMIKCSICWAGCTRSVAALLRTTRKR
jgi:hypothetical protein